MPQPLLIGIDEVMGRLSFSSTQDIREAVEGAIRAATASMVGTLRTELDAATAREDLFRVTESGAREGFTHHELILSRGFVSDVTTANFLAVSAPHIRQLDDVSIRTDLRAFAFETTEDTLSIDAERGLVSVDDVDLKGQIVRMTYNAGFSVDTDDEYEATPNWLVEAAYLAAAIALDANPIIRRDDEAEAQLNKLQRQLDVIVQSHVRYAPRALRPGLYG